MGLPQPRPGAAHRGHSRPANTLSVTRGVVSRVEHQGGAHSGVELLAAQIDAAVNAGNSGEPVLASGRVVGIPGLGRLAEHFLHDSHAGGEAVPAPPHPAGDGARARLRCRARPPPARRDHVHRRQGDRERQEHRVPSARAHELPPALRPETGGRGRATLATSSMAASSSPPSRRTCSAPWARGMLRRSRWPRPTGTGMPRSPCGNWWCCSASWPTRSTGATTTSNRKSSRQSTAFDRVTSPAPWSWRRAVPRRQENILKTYSVPAGRSVELNRKGQ